MENVNLLLGTLLCSVRHDCMEVANSVHVVVHFLATASNRVLYGYTGGGVTGIYVKQQGFMYVR